VLTRHPLWMVGSLTVSSRFMKQSRMLDRLPPRWVRRLVIAPFVFVGALIVAVLSPFIHLLVAIFDLIFDRRRWRLSRVVGIGLAFSVAEFFGLFALLTVWVGSVFGLFIRRPFWVRANDVLTGQYMAMVGNAIGYFVGFEYSLTMDQPAPGLPQLVFTRHAGPGDMFLLMKAVFRDMGRRCHAVGANKLQWDPFLDIAGERLDFQYVHQNPEEPGAELDKIRQVAAGMGSNETLILCPEGGNFTPGRRLQRIEAERLRGRSDRAALAESLRHTLLPRSGGALAALDGAPSATITFLGHAGLDDIDGFASLWKNIPLDRTVVARGWTVPVDDLPADRAGRTNWLFSHWRELDVWIDEALESYPRTDDGESDSLPHSRTEP
jgi:hypothetical protein